MFAGNAIDINSGNYIPLPQGEGGVHPLNFFDPPQHCPSTGGVNSSYTYPDRVYTILSYRRLLE